MLKTSKSFASCAIVVQVNAQYEILVKLAGPTCLDALPARRPSVLVKNVSPSFEMSFAEQLFILCSSFIVFTRNPNSVTESTNDFLLLDLLPKMARSSRVMDCVLRLCWQKCRRKEFFSPIVSLKLLFMMCYF